MAHATARQTKDYVIATGEQHSVREFVERAARFIDRKIEWVGDAENEID